MTISIDNLAHSFGQRQALRGISGTLRPGRITAVLGPNAAGKSTLLRCVAGVLRPSSGQVVVDGLVAHRTSPRVLAAHLAYVPQRSIVSAAFSVRQVIELGRYALSANPGRVKDAIARLELAEESDRQYAELSAGQQQRVTLARALAQLEPCGHLILDEPVSAMDLRHVQQCMNLLRQLAADGVAVLMVVHDLTLAAAIADDVWLLDDGRLVGSGAVGEVMTRDRLEGVFRVGFESSAADGIRAFVPSMGSQLPRGSGIGLQ